MPSFFKVVRFPERPYLHIRHAAFKRYLHSKPLAYEINLLLCHDLRYVVRVDEIDDELFLTTGWSSIQGAINIGLKYILVFVIEDTNTWTMTILGDNSVGVDVGHVPPNYDPPPVAVTNFSEIVKIKKKVAYKVPKDLADLANLAETMHLKIKVEDHNVHVIQSNNYNLTCAPTNRVL